MRRLVAACVALALGGCAVVNEGTSDIRRFRHSNGTSGTNTELWSVRGSTSGQTPAQRGDTVLITLDRVFVSDFAELRFSPGNILIRQDPFASTGEIAVLFAVEQGAQPISMSSFDNHVVVAYSDAVREGQFLNVRNQRIFGPTRVDSNFLNIEVVLLEVDRPTDQETALFSQLATLGKQLGGVTTGTTFDVLSELGSSLLDAAHDDTQMEFIWNFDLGTRPDARMPLTPGLYAIARTERSGYRDATPGARATEPMIGWAALCLDEDTGELHKAVPKAAAGGGDGNHDAGGRCAGERYIEDTYVVINVEIGLPEQGLDNPRFSAFVQDLRAVETDTIGAFSTAAQGLADSYAMGERRAAIADGLSRFRRAVEVYGVLNGSCAPDKTHRLTAARNAMMTESSRLHEAIRIEALTLAPPAGTTEDDPYDAAAYGRQIEQLTTFFGSLWWAADDDARVQLLISSARPSEFETVFGDASTFFARVEKRALELWPAPACASGIAAKP